MWELFKNLLVAREEFSIEKKSFEIGFVRELNLCAENRKEKEEKKKGSTSGCTGCECRICAIYCTDTVLEEWVV